jgi:3-deoxy-manno-octulosonate cytidylyltransferase (CMP-KDO synthetase)
VNLKKAKGGKRKKVIGIIPARFASTRLPAKALADIHGKPMIQHVYERCLKARLLDEVLVATDDMRIFSAVQDFGGNAVMTSRRHKSGTDRLGEAAAKLKFDIVVNIQGDEPLIDPRNIDSAVLPLLNDNSINVSTLAFRMKNSSGISNPSAVKVVFDENYFALYFSRSPIPNNRNGAKGIVYYKHIGLYVYRRDYLLELVKLKAGKLESAEKLEQLRILESGGKIKVVITGIDSHAVDTKADLYKIRKLIRG